MMSAAQSYSSQVIQLRGSGVSIAADRWEPAGDRLGTIVLLHGGGQTRHSWRSAGPMLARAGWQVYTFDARGHGDSDWAPDADYTVEAMAADLAAVVGQIGEPAVLIGASMGGITALMAEGELGGLARALVLVDITPKIESAGVLRIREFMTSAPDGFASLEEVAAAVQAYQPHRVRPVNTESMRKNVRQGKDGRWRWHWDPAFTEPGKNFIVDEDRLAEAARRVGVPVLLVRGEHSDVVSSAGVDALLELIPAAQAVEVRQAGHMVAGDDNAIFLEHVLGFLTKELRSQELDRDM
jgi:pimeloyl-ACP methyl ester carboxylesterase